MSFISSTGDRWKRGSFPFKTLFELSLYDFRFPRYRRIKRRVIFNRLLSSSSSSRSEVSLALPSRTADERQTWFLEKRSTRFLEKNVGRGFIHHPRRRVLSTRKTLNCYNSASDRDIGIKQKAISMVSSSPLSVQFSITKFLTPSRENLNFHS